MEEVIKAERVRVFIPDDDLVWLSCDIVQEVKPGHYECEVTDVDYPATKPRRRIITMRTLCRQVDSLPLQNEGMTDEGVDDMTSLNYLHEPSILDNLRRRHKTYLPYTYTGEIVIAINPYQWLNIYSTQLMEQHAGNLRHEISPPHVYATSAAAYRGLRDYNKNQSILVSGESGAGKTETVKILMGHIAHISGRQNMTTIDRVLKANPLLESFGNAKTSRNDNSSRFGKFTRLQFDQYATLSGSRCVTYLLEKSRVIIQQNSQERNYHIFHQVFAAPPAVKTSLHLGGAHVRDFRYTGNGDVLTDTIEGEHDGDRFRQTMQILELLGVNADQQADLQRIIAGICYLGQVTFLGDTERSYIDSKVKADCAKCCELLGLDVGLFEKDTTVRRIVTSEGEMLLNLSREQASDGRDALAKDAYDRLFQWLVVAINESTAAHGLERDRAYRGSERIIALLDIFGFESFQVNRFEQLCINYANEKLQQKFTQDVFMAVQEEYKNEGLEWELIGYKDNADVLDLLEGRLGIMALLNEECLIPRGNDTNFLTKIAQNTSKHPCIHVGGLDTKRDEFQVHHYAGKVTYCAAGFVELNRDAIPSELRQLMLSSTNKLLNKIFAVDAEATKAETVSRGARSKQSFMKADTVTTKFRAQLNSLMETISKTTVQYVRCIKPNSEKSKDLFDRSMVVEQLRCAGMIEAIRISRAAYPYRITHDEFAARFGGLRSGPWMRRQGVRTAADRCRVLLDDVLKHLTEAQRKVVYAKVGEGGLSDKPYEMGRTRVYFSAGVFEMLESMRGGVIFTHIKCIQRVWRGSKARKLYHKMRRCGALLKRVLRGWKHRRRFWRLRSATVTLQTLMRARIARRAVATLRRFTYTVRLQSWARMVPRRRLFLRMRRAARLIGRWMKVKYFKKVYKKLQLTDRENKRMSVQLDNLKVRLSAEAEAREAAEKKAAENIERERQLLELERREAAAAAELEKQRVMEQARRELEEERQRLLAGQEKLKLEALQLVHAKEENEAKKAAEVDKLQAELAAMRDAQAEAALKMTTMQEEATRKVELERSKLKEEQDALRAEIMAEAQRNEALAQEQAHARLLKYHEREKEELLALEALQAELARLRQKNDQLLTENSDLKSSLRREAVNADFRSGEIAVVKVQLENMTRDRDQVVTERDRALRMMRQYKLEKSHVMEALLELSKELDEAHKVQQDMYRDVLHEQRAKQSQEVQTVALLKSRGVGKAIIEDLKHVVYGHTAVSSGSSRDDDVDTYEDDDEGIAGARPASPMRSDWLQPMTTAGGGTAAAAQAGQRAAAAAGSNAKTRELARRRKQAFALRGDRPLNDRLDTEPSVITQSTSNGSTDLGQPGAGALLRERDARDGYDVEPEPELEPEPEPEPEPEEDESEPWLLPNAGARSGGASGGHAREPIVLQSLTPSKQPPPPPPPPPQPRPPKPDAAAKPDESASGGGSWVPSFGLF